MRGSTLPVHSRPHSPAVFSRRITGIPRSLALCLLLAPASLLGADALKPHELEFFESRIRPVLVEKCYSCHAADAKNLRAGLLLDTRDGLLTGGDSGPAVVPGNVEESLLIEALKYESYEMPPEGKLSDDVIADFVKWVEMGATDPRDGTVKLPQTTIDLEAGREFWSFRPLGDHPAPAVADRGWPRTDIDRFLLSRLESEGLAPAPDADRQTLIRRLTFDLTGLPPTPEEIEAFLANPAEDDVAVAAVVDRLLASPRFGERWGRHWLDVARYSQSTGGGRSALYGESWRYRDYVIEAFNTDKPFDRFVLEQLAGDLLPADNHRQAAEQITATAFLALGPTNYEQQDKLVLQMDVIDEQIDTTGRAFLAMTLGCARCHDHKFDPIPTADYYALAGIFRNTDSLVDGNVSSWIKTPLPEPPEQAALRKEHEQKLAKLDKQLKRMEKEIAELRSGLPAASIIVDDVQAQFTGEWTASTSVKGFTGEGYHHAKGDGAIAAYEIPVEPGRYEVRLTYTEGTNRSPNSLVIVKHAEGESRRRIDQRPAPSLPGHAISLGEFTFEETARITVSTEGASGVVVADSVQLARVDPSDEADAPEQAQREQLAAAVASRDEVKQRRDKLAKQAPPVPPMLVSVRDAAKIQEGQICIRGNAHQPGEKVPRGFLQVAEYAGQPELPADGSGRLELARWIASPENPLTARVYVNRVWQHLFGDGLVRTVDNFGLPGERPSHPELLDHLARRFIDCGWSTKQMIREIVLSRAYRMSSESNPDGVRKDPGNKLLWRQNRRRLEAEAIHDALLTLSGRLDCEAGGPSVRPDTNSEYGYEFEYGRRAVYLPVFRNRLPELFAAFDFPDPNQSVGRRNETTLATQALYLLNSPFVMQEAERAAERFLTEVPSDPARLERLYLTAVGRHPSPPEITAATGFLAEINASEAETRRAWALLCQSLIASVDFRYVD